MCRSEPQVFFRDGNGEDSGVTHFAVREWESEQGLPSSRVNVIVQTRDGYLWLGTEEGLARFDGGQFVVFDRQTVPVFSCNVVRALAEDRDGSLWIGTHGGGLLHMVRGKFTAFRTPDGLPSDFVSSLLADTSGILWVGTDGGGLALMEHGRLRQAPGVGTGTITEMCMDTHGNLYAGTLGSGLITLQSGQDLPVMHQNGLTDARVTALCLNREGTLLVGTMSGLFTWTGKKFQRDLSYDRLIGGAVEVIFEDRHRDLWIGTKDGLYTLRGSQCVPLKDIENSSILCLHEDREGSLWVGKENGLSQVRHTSLVTYSCNEGLSNDVVLSITEGPGGKLWFGTASGLNALSGGRIDTVVRNQYVSSILANADGTLWIGTYWRGLNFLRDGILTPFNLGPGTAFEQIYALYRDLNGNIWAGTSAGLARIRGNSVTRFTTEQGLSNNFVRAICSDSSGNLWVGTSFGLNCYSGGHFTRLPGLSSDIINTLCVDESNTIWVGTYGGGLNRVRNGKLDTFTSQKGFYSDVVYQIIDDRHGNLWMSCNKGVFSVKKAELDALAEGSAESITTTIFGTGDGLRSNECTGTVQPAGWRSGDGRIWFPTKRGVVALQPGEIPVSRNVPPAVIEQFIADKDTVALGDKIEIPPGASRFEFHYSALSFLSADRVTFLYKLEGFDKEWIDGGKNRVAYYTNLPSGHFTFRVIARIDGGTWDQQGAGLVFTIRPPLWLSWWFQSSVALVLFGIGFVAYNVKITQLLRERSAQREFSQQLIDQQEMERKRIAAELHDSLGQNILVIKNRAFLGLQARGDNSGMVGQLNEISLLASETLDEVRTISHDLRPIHLDQLGLTDTLSSLIGHVAEISTIAFETHIDVIDDLIPKQFEIHIFRIVQESLNNILKHSGAAHAWISTRRRDDRLVVEVRDDGKGFAQGGGQRTSGYGLAGIRERVKIMEGELVLESVPGKGTTMIVSVPTKGEN